ncbi:hypothetical protein B0J15DRAFT_127797 [Fusarium solani]|uniref:Uncharacterized protein n=1 Tax=Fusarium solani TaxID=169388 RepID=A0A9P9L5I2_FUSSL|nr:uncharacterized protein B0J15DRAFT_127797 [Fusarium solani]KAH7274361.1 hypothetical protein B0J15DRAFT_127797 [Fusarium solani]
MIPQPSRGIDTFSILNDDVEVGIGDAFSRSGAHLASTGLEVRWGRPVRGLVGLFLGSFLQVRKGKCRKRGKETWQASKSIEFLAALKRFRVLQTVMSYLRFPCLVRVLPHQGLSIVVVGTIRAFFLFILKISFRLVMILYDKITPLPFLHPV